MPYFVSILYSPSLDKYYIGYTADLTDRLIKHLAKHKGFTGSHNDWQLAYHETFDNKHDALQREQQIKSWKSRKMIERLIRLAG